MKKIILALVAILVIGAGVLFAINSKSNYDPTKYYLKITPQDKPFDIGSKIEFKLPDQFNRAHELSDDTKKLIFVFTKETGHTFKSFMANKKKGFLEEKKAVAVADVSKMPTFILNTFAMPDFKKSNYPLLLIYDKEMAKKLKENRDTTKVIVVDLDKRRVKKINYAKDEKELESLVK